MIDNIQHRSGATVAQRAPIYINVNKDGRARNQAYLNLYASRVGAPVIAVDDNGSVINFSTGAILEGITSANGGGALGGGGNTDKIPGPGDAVTFEAPSGLDANWVGTSVVVTWSFDTSLPANQYVTQFWVTLTPQGGSSHTFYYNNVNKTSASQSFTLSASDNATYFGKALTFTTFTVVAADAYGHESFTATLNKTITYSPNLPKPVITITSINQGYQVSWTDISSQYPSFQYLSVEEVISSSSTDPGTGYNQVYLNKINPAVIITGGLEKRWVRARFSDGFGAYGDYSDAIAITPTPIVTVNTTPPNEVTSVSAAFSTSDGGNDILVTVTLPSTNIGNSFIVKLIPTAAPGLAGYFYFFPPDTNSPKTFTVVKSDIFAQFGAYYSSYSGTLISVSSVGNRSNGVAIPTFSRTNPLTGVTPTFSVVPAANGYTLTWQNVTGATYADIYESATSWGNSNPADETLRVYSGQSPVTIQSLNYSTRYIKIRFYDDYGDTSNYSAEQTVVPYDPGLLSLISNPVSFQTNGSILAGSYNSSTGSLSYPNVIFNTAGIFAYDASGAPTTEIINNAASGANTFITKRAQIADWSISTQKIENTLYGSSGTSTYVGLSGSSANGYVIWAGSPVAGGSALANFTVTASGTVTARNINIYGGTLSVGSNFNVTSDGTLTAQNGNFIGDLTALSGRFNGNVKLNGGSLYAGDIANGPLTVFNSNGIGVYSGALSNHASTEIITHPVDANQTTPGGNTMPASNITLFTSAAIIGGWIVGPTKISDTSNLFNIDSSSNQIFIQGTTSSTAPYLKISTGQYNSFAQKNTVIEAGGDKTAAPSFYIDSSGVMYSKGANIDGAAQITGNIAGGTLTSENQTPSSLLHGYYFNQNGNFVVGNAGGYIYSNGSSILLSSGNMTGGERAYAVSAKVSLDSSLNSLGLYGLPFQGNTVSVAAPVGGVMNILTEGYPGNPSGYYANAPQLGALPRQRTVVEDPATGQLKVGMAVYYQDLTNGSHTTDPTTNGGYNSGAIGDLWVRYT